MRDATLLFAIGVAVPGTYSWPAGEEQTPLELKVLGTPFVEVPVQTAEKSPLSMAVVGTVKVAAVACWRRRFHSSPTKKKSLSLIMGPPTKNPKSLKIS